MRTWRFHPVTTLADGCELGLHIHEITGGAGDGPTLGVSGGVHGDEHTGARIILALARGLDPARMKGRLLLLPVANPLAFAAVSRCTPHDHQNMNRVFPGDASGWVTEQIAHAMTEQFLSHIDAYVDLHTGTDRPTVDYVYIRNDEGLSRAFGSRVLYRPTAGRGGTMYSGTTSGVVEARGAPSVTVELGGGAIDQRPYVARGVEGLLNVMRRLSMLDGAEEPPPAQIVVKAITILRPAMGGFLESEAPALGEEIAGGAVLGRVWSPYRLEELEVIRNPVARGIMILSHLTPNLVEPGDYGYMVGDLDGAER